VALQEIPNAQSVFLLQLFSPQSEGHRMYPEEGTVASLIDTCYEGFAYVPGAVFQDPGLNELRTEN